MHVEILATEALGDRSYVLHDGKTALVIDPQRDLDRVHAVLDRHGLRCAAIAETHIHNDYLTGGHALSRRTGADYLVNTADPVLFDRHGVRDGDELSVGRLRIRVLATPGHTLTHLAYVVDDTAHPHEPSSVFTGGSLLFGSVGRTDLVDAGRTREMTRLQYRSARRLADALTDDTRIYPTHGFGSFCSATGATGTDTSTIGAERAVNHALTTHDQQQFVDTLVASLTAYPRYYTHMGAQNLAGPTAADLSPPERVESEELHKRIAAGEWIVDLRDRTVYAAEHLAGSINIALGDQFSTYLGWILPWDTPVTLMAESAVDIADAQRQLSRLGIDHLTAAIRGTGDLTAREDLRSYPSATFADLAARGGHNTVEPLLDVRRHDERARGAIPGSIHVPLQDLTTRLEDLPPGRLWVHCAAGFRAGIGASLLDRAGRDVVVVDDDYGHAVNHGLATG
jgi:glyoxylase-like metal-dependent hydrolase (beta-lactamase superfamily II)/rhodanese-related sulfurtransferase